MKCTLDFGTMTHVLKKIFSHVLGFYKDSSTEKIGEAIFRDSRSLEESNISVENESHMDEKMKQRKDSILRT